MSKTKTISTLAESIEEKLRKAKEELEKARRRMSDEYDPNDMGDDVQDESDELGEGYREFDPDTEEDDAAKWLQENDPEAQGGSRYDEYGEDEDEDAHQRSIEEDLGDEDTNPQMDLPEERAQQASTESGEFGSEASQEKGSQEVNKPKYKATQMFGFDDLGQIKSAKSLDQAKEYAKQLVNRQKAAFGSNKDAAHKMIDGAKSIDDLMVGMYNTSEQYNKISGRELANRNQAGYGPTGSLPKSESKKSSRWNQPTREELNALRGYTRPWEQRAREAAALKADPSKNPELARHGNIIEARNQAHGDRNAAYRALTASDEYKNADPITQMEMDDNFEKDWSSKNPEHLKTALTAHHEAHQKGKGARDVHAAAKDAKIRNIISGGGHGGEGYSLEEGMQHAGGTKGEEGTQATVKQDPASSFAMGNQDFINQYAKDYANKGKKVANIDEMSGYDEGSKRDISRILGEGPAKDPKFEEFFSHYYPLIGMNAHKSLNRMGLDPKHPDIDMSMLHEAGMHGLIQAMNDYDHDNPGKASFATHAANKIRGLQMTALKNQDAIPTEVRQAQKKFASQQSAPKPKVDLHQLIGASQHPKATDMQDRLKRVGAQRQAQSAVKIRKGPGNTGGQGGGL